MTQDSPGIPTPQAIDGLIAAVFAADHARDLDAFLALLRPDIAFRFGSAPVLYGQVAVAAMVRGLFDSVEGITHRLVHRWIDGAEVAYAGEVTFMHRGGTQVVLPYVNTLKLDEDGRVADYRIHIDPTPLNGDRG